MTTGRYADGSLITVTLVRRLLEEQFPQWSDLPITTVGLEGWDNTTFRLGERMSLRLPNEDGYAAQAVKEHRWLPVLAPLLPVEIPEVIGKGEPTRAFPRPGPSAGGSAARP